MRRADGAENTSYCIEGCGLMVRVLDDPGKTRCDSCEARWYGSYFRRRVMEPNDILMKRAFRFVSDGYVL